MIRLSRRVHFSRLGQRPRTLSTPVIEFLTVIVEFINSEFKRRVFNSRFRRDNRNVSYTGWVAGQQTKIDTTLDILDVRLFYRINKRRFKKNVRRPPCL